MTLKQRIMGLRSQGKSYKTIKSELGCSLSTVAYYLNATSKAKTLAATRNRKRMTIVRLKQEFGGECEICKFSEHLGALQFHHKNPKTKKFHISQVRGLPFEEIRKEAQKCALVCGNCHTMIHAGLINCP